MSRSRTGLLIGAIGLVIGGLAPLLTGLAGFWGYATQGYFIGKSGEKVDGPPGMIFCGFLVLAGLGMIICAVWLYRKQSRALGK